MKFIPLSTRRHIDQIDDHGTIYYIKDFCLISKALTGKKRVIFSPVIGYEKLIVREKIYLVMMTSIVIFDTSFNQIERINIEPFSSQHTFSFVIDVIFDEIVVLSSEQRLHFIFQQQEVGEIKIIRSYFRFVCQENEWYLVFGLRDPIFFHLSFNKLKIVFFPLDPIKTDLIKSGENIVAGFDRNEQKLFIYRLSRDKMTVWREFNLFVYEPIFVSHGYLVVISRHLDYIVPIPTSPVLNIYDYQRVGIILDDYVLFSSYYGSFYLISSKENNEFRNYLVSFHHLALPRLS